MSDTQVNVGKSLNKENSSKLEVDPRSEITTTVERLEGTPFVCRWMADYGWAIGIGIKRISKFYESKEELMEWLDKMGMDWEMVAMMVDALVETRLEYNEIERRSENGN